MKSILIPAALALCAAIPAANAQTITYNWTLGNSSLGAASGTLTIDATSDLGYDASRGYQPFNGSGYDYTLLAFSGSFTSGTLGGSSISLLGGSELNLTGSSASTDVSGISASLDIGGNDNFVLYGGTENYPPSPYTVYATGGGGPYDNFDDTFTLSPSIAPVPESPLSPGLVMAAGLFFGWRGWRGCKKLKS